MTHPNVELMSLLVDDEKRRVKAIEHLVDPPVRPGMLRRAIGKSLIAIGEQVAGAGASRTAMPVGAELSTRSA